MNDRAVAEKKNPYGISLGFICRHNDPLEVQTIDKMLTSVAAHVDEIICTITIPDADAVASEELLFVLRKFNAVITEPFVWKRNWAQARNFNMKFCTMPYYLWLDADDILIGGELLPGLVRKLASSDDFNAVFFDYNYAQDEEGRCISLFPRERLVKREYFGWVGWIHENCMCKVAMKADRTHDVVVKHNIKGQDVRKKALRNLEVAKEAYEEQVKRQVLDPRLVFDLARSYESLGLINESEEKFVQFLGLNPSLQDSYDTYLRLGRLYLMTGRLNNAIDFNWKGIRLKWDWPFAYWQLAECLINKDEVRELERAKFYLDTGSRFKPPEIGYAYDPQEAKIKPLILFHEILFRQSRGQDAIKVLRQALKIEPKNTELLGLLDRNHAYLNAIAGERGIQVLYEFLKKERDDKIITNPVFEERIRHLSQGVPEKFQFFRPLALMRNDINPPNPNKRIIFYCGFCAERWDPTCEETGIGGSEEAVINMARELKKQGWRPEVYGDPKKRGVYDGVPYKHYHEYDYRFGADIFISWRAAEFIKHAHHDSAKLVWCHDKQKAEHYSIGVVKVIDKIMVLSKYHRKDLPDFPEEKFFITRNGINPDHFSRFDEGRRDPNRIIYASSPDRGLELILASWPRIKRINPKAELHVFYGFMSKFEKAGEHEVGRWQAKNRIIEALKKVKDQDVHWHDRVGHRELADWMQKCGLWLYPTAFPEISCITAMKVQAAGCFPVCNDFAALDETVFSGWKVKGEMSDPMVLEEWLNAYREAVEFQANNPKDAEENRKHISATAKERFSWAGVAREWSDLFTSLVKEKKKQKEAENAKGKRISGNDKADQKSPQRED